MNATDFPAVEADELIEAAQRKRRAAPPLVPTTRRRKAKAAAEPQAETPVDQPAESSEVAAEPTTRKRRRAPKLAGQGEALADLPEPTPAPRLAVWSITAAAAAALLVVLTVHGLVSAPATRPIEEVRVLWLPGPQVSQKEVLSWISRFPQRDKLIAADAWTLARLGEFLASQEMVAEVRSVSTRHEPVPLDVGGIRRVLEVELGLRQPVMPAILSTGQRAWVDVDGHRLPGSLSGPEVRRPLLRDLEKSDPVTIRTVVEAWLKLEPQIEKGLVTDIALNDPIDDRGTCGVVFYTSAGTRLVWGRTEEARFGLSTEDRVRDLVHTIRCQGDMARVAEINVRYRQPFFTLKD